MTATMHSSFFSNTLGRHHQRSGRTLPGTSFFFPPQVGCSLVAYFVHVHERFTARRIRWSLRANLLLVIGLVQLVPRRSLWCRRPRDDRTTAPVGAPVGRIQSQGW